MKLLRIVEKPWAKSQTVLCRNVPTSHVKRSQLSDFLDLSFLVWKMGIRHPHHGVVVGISKIIHAMPFIHHTLCGRLSISGGIR